MKSTILKRLLGFLIDASIIAVITVSLLYVLFLLAINIQFEWIRNVTYLTAWFSYYVFFEACFDRTIGKMAMRTKVQTEGPDAPPKIFQILLRTLTRAIPFDPLSVFIDGEGRMWHDKLSRTRVVEM